MADVSWCSSEAAFNGFIKLRVTNSLLMLIYAFEIEIINGCRTGSEVPNDVWVRPIKRTLTDRIASGKTLVRAITSLGLGSTNSPDQLLLKNQLRTSTGENLYEIRFPMNYRAMRVCAKPCCTPIQYHGGWRRNGGVVFGLNENSGIDPQFDGSNPGAEASELNKFSKGYLGIGDQIDGIPDKLHKIFWTIKSLIDKEGNFGHTKPPAPGSKPRFQIPDRTPYNILCGFPGNGPGDPPLTLEKAVNVLTDLEQDLRSRIYDLLSCDEQDASFPCLPNYINDCGDLSWFGKTDKNLPRQDNPKYKLFDFYNEVNMNEIGSRDLELEHLSSMENNDILLANSASIYTV